jgi:hypothetical protein
MAEEFLNLSRKDRKDAIGTAATSSGRPAHLLEKDVWVVWVLAILFESKSAANLVFKGGTSLSKAYKAIDRFSEDIDVTYSIRALIPKTVGKAPDALPLNPSQRKKWVGEINIELPKWITKEILPLFQARVKGIKASAKVRADKDCAFIDYEQEAEGYGYVKPTVKIDFGARSTGEPSEIHAVYCDAAEHLPDLVFPTASPRVMSAERTFWEKATAIHMYCLTGKLPGEAIARHWYDVVCLDKAGYVKAALNNNIVAQDVAHFKDVFFPAKDRNGNQISYVNAVSGSLQLVPTGAELERLRVDYEKMVADRLLTDSVKKFDTMIGQCRQIQERARKVAGAR